MLSAFGLEPRLDPRPLLLLDLDGTVRHCWDDVVPGFVNEVEDVVVYVKALVRMREWNRRGGRIVACSNQGGIALGHLSMDTAAAILRETNTQCGDLFDAMLICNHHPDADDPAMRRCWCRKPQPGMLVEAAMTMAIRYPGTFCPISKTVFVGDRPEDRYAADRAGVDFLDAQAWRDGASYDRWL